MGDDRVAVMQGNGITEIISTDEHLDRVEGIIRLDPQVFFTERGS